MHFVPKCCIFALQYRKGPSAGPFFIVAKGVKLFGRQEKLSPKQFFLSPKACLRFGRVWIPWSWSDKNGCEPLNFHKRRHFADWRKTEDFSTKSGFRRIIFFFHTPTFFHDYPTAKPAKSGVPPGRRQIAPRRYGAGEHGRRGARRPTRGHGPGRPRRDNGPDSPYRDGR